MYPSVFSLTKFPVKIGQVPPIINPKVAGPELFNTEHLKNSHVLKNVKSIQGSQNKLVELLVAGEVDLGTLDSMSHEDLKTLCHQLNFQSISRYNNSARSYIFRSESSSRTVRCESKSQSQSQSKKVEKQAGAELYQAQHSLT